MLSVFFMPYCALAEDTAQPADSDILKGRTYTEASGFTPWVGRNYIISNINDNLVSVIGANSALDNILDKDLTNSAEFFGTVDAGVAYQPSIAVKSLDKVYKEGCTAGFAISNGNGKLLELSVIKLLVVETYLNGQPQEKSLIDDSSSKLLNLSLVTIGNEDVTKLTINTTKPFDEIRFSVGGVDANVINQLKVYYAFVDVNPQRVPITQKRFPNAETGEVDKRSSDKLVGEDENDGITLELIGSLISGLGKEWRVTTGGPVIPAGSEVGFKLSSGSVLDLSLIKTIVIKTYKDVNVTRHPFGTIKDNEWTEVESQAVVSVANLGLAGGGEYVCSVITKEDCTGVGLTLGGVNVNLGVTKIHYAFYHDLNPIYDDDCDLQTSSDIILCGQKEVFVPGESGLSFTFAPAGPSASAYDESKKGYTISGLQRNTEYEVTVTKGMCTSTFTITNDPCNTVTTRPIVGDNVTFYDGKTNFKVLGVDLTKNGSPANALDDDLTNEYIFSKGLKLDLIENDVIFGVTRTDNTVYYASKSQPRRVGVVMQSDDKLLNVSALDYYTITTYLNGAQQEVLPADDNSSVKADLISSGNYTEQARVSAKATMPFDAFVLKRTGILDLGIDGGIKVYYAFEGDGSTDSEAMASYDLMTYDTGARICYKHTCNGFDGVASVGNTVTNLENLIDGNFETSTVLGGLATVGGKRDIAVKSSRIYNSGTMGYAGFIIKNNQYLGNAGVIKGIKLCTYLNDEPTGDKTTEGGLLSAELLGHSGYSLLQVPVTAPFNEVALETGGLAEAIDNIEVIGAFYYSDTDGDGIADALDQSPCNSKAPESATGAVVVCDFDAAEENNNYANHVYVLSAGDIDGINATNVNSNSSFTVYRRPSNPNAPIDYTSMDGFEEVGTLTMGAPVTEGNYDIYTPTITDGQGKLFINQDYISAGALRLKAKKDGTANDKLLPVDNEIIGASSYPVLIHFRDVFSASIEGNKHPDSYTYVVKYNSGSSTPLVSNFNSVFIPKAEITAELNKYDYESEIKPDVNMTLDLTKSVVATINDANDYTTFEDTAKRSYAVNDSKDVTELTNGGAANVYTSPTEQGDVRVTIKSDNLVNEHNVFGGPAAKVTLPSIKFNSAQITGDGHVRRSEKTISIDYDPQYFEPVHFNIWRKVDEEIPAGKHFTHFDSQTGYDRDATGGFDLVETYGTDNTYKTTSWTADKDAFNHTENVYLAGSREGITVDYIGRLYFKVLDPETTLSTYADNQESGNEAAAAPQYIAVEARTNVAPEMVTGVDEIGTDANTFNAWSVATGSIEVEAPDVTDIYNGAGIKVATVEGNGSVNGLEGGLYIAKCHESAIKVIVR